MDNEHLIRLAKHHVKKMIGKPDPIWPFYSFEHAISKKSLQRYDEIRSWTEECVAHIPEHESAKLYENSTDPVVKQGYELKRNTESAFREKYKGHTDLRFLIQLPDQAFSAGGYSALLNIIESLTFLGIPAHALGWNDDTQQILETFKPTVFLITDHAAFLARVDWDAIAAYKSAHGLHLGLLAHLEEYGNTPLPQRLEWAKEHNVDFYFSFRNEKYFRTREAYKPFFERGYEIVPIEFGANVLRYYPVPNITRDLDYIFLATTNWRKGPHYQELAQDIVSRYIGFIDGFGWKHAKEFSISSDRNRYLYARGKVGLNFHLDEQIEWACEVNERTHQLAACGIPQLTDNAKLLPELYSSDAICIGSNKKEFKELFERLINDSSFAQSRALKAQQEVFAKHTTFHRAEAFFTQLSALLK